MIIRNTNSYQAYNLCGHQTMAHLCTKTITHIPMLETMLD